MMSERNDSNTVDGSIYYRLVRRLNRKVNFSNPMYVVPAVKLSVVVVVCCICVWGAMDLVLWKRNSVLYDVPNVESEAFRESYTELILELTKIEESAVRPEASTVSNRSSLFEGRQKIAVVEQAPKTNPAALLDRKSVV